MTATAAPEAPPTDHRAPSDTLRRLLARLWRSYPLRATLQALFTVWLVLTVTFVLIRLLPSNPVDVLVDQLIADLQITREEALAQASALFSVDFRAPIGEQYVEYISNLVRGDLGVSIFSTGTPVSDIIARFLPWTLFCVGLGLLLSFVVGLLLGMVMAYWRNSLLDTALTTVTSFLSSIPSYLIPLLLIYLVALQWRLIPVSQMRGAYDPNLTPAFTPTFILSVVRYATLPVLTYILSQVGHWALSMKNSTIGVLGEEYVNAAHARGLRRGRIMTAYVGRNAALPLFTQFALSLGTIFGGAILIELFFSYPGIGIRLYEAILRRDYPVMQGIFLMITITTIIANLLADFFYAQLDPRVRVGD